MKSIYACKLYRVSSRKSNIVAAMENPINKELVEQISSYLDDEYEEKLHEAQQQRANDLSQSLSDRNESNDDVSKGGPSTTHAGGGGFGEGPSGPRPSLSDRFAELVESDPEDTDTDSEDIDIDSESDESMSEGEEDTVDDLEPIDESSNIAQDSVKGAEISLADSVEEIKGMLNSDDDTQGVTRVCIKDDEMWIYYNDDMNLNNVMVDVIESLSASGYTYLQFNRLARSNNAIVFQVNTADTGVNQEDIDGEQ